MSDRGDAWILTVTGRAFYPLDPRASEIHIEDIAHALANTCRFTGHVLEFYSVGEHSLRVSHQVPPQDQLWALLHDASEAYLADVASPIKRTDTMAAYRDAESTLMRAVCERFWLPTEEPESVRLADKRMLLTERRDLMPHRGPWRVGAAGGLEPYPMRIRPMSPKSAKRMFLERFAELSTAGYVRRVS